MQPIRIGIWCDYGVTLMPTEGIGVFVYNLVNGLLSLDEPVEVTMLVRPGDQQVVADYAKKFPGRLRVVPEIWPSVRFSSRLTNLLQTGVRLLAVAQRKIHGLKRRLGNRPSTIEARKFPFSVLHFLSSVFDSAPLFNSLATREQAGCDVWLIPSIRFRHALSFPSVLVIHDLVHIHYPDAVPNAVREELHRLAGPLADQATLCACMSSFIRDTDLLGVLQLDPAKVRLVRPAAPADFPRLDCQEAAGLKPAQMIRPYLFYPAAFRSYKNHQALVEALHILGDRHGEEGFDVVFTGIHSPPKNLVRKIDEYGLAERVHVLRCVDRRTLAALYRCAFATIVPSLYEQGSFPIYEALQSGCPVACSRIPSLLEQCRPMGDAMLYFDPLDTGDLARTILRIRDRRETILERQQSTGKTLWQRTWTDAARDWLAVFREAVAIAANGGQPKQFGPTSKRLRRSA